MLQILIAVEIRIAAQCLTGRQSVLTSMQAGHSVQDGLKNQPVLGLHGPIVFNLQASYRPRVPCQICPQQGLGAAAMGSSSFWLEVVLSSGRAWWSKHAGSSTSELLFRANGASQVRTGCPGEIWEASISETYCPDGRMRVWAGQRYGR